MQERIVQRSDYDSLRSVGIRPTRPRLGVMRAIREGGRRHLAPETFHRELATAGVRMSLATVYNTLNHFAEAGLLRRVGVGDRSWFCTNAGEHSHFLDEDTGELIDILGPQPRVEGLPQAPEGMVMSGVEVVIRVRRTANGGCC